MAGLVRISKPGHGEYEVELSRAAQLERYGWSVVTEPEVAVARVVALESTVVDLQGQVDDIEATGGGADPRVDTLISDVDAVTTEVGELTQTVEATTVAQAPKPTPRTDALEAWRSTAEPVIAGLHPVASSGDYSDLSNRPTLGTMAAQGKSVVDITGGTITGITDLAVADGGTGASTPANARSNLGLGGAATLEVGTTAGTVAAGNDPRLSDARTPTAHTHPAGQVTGLATVATSGAYSDLSGRPTLATVATSGSYNDLTDKPAGGGAGPLRLAADQTFSTTTLANVTGFSFAVAANTAYQFEALLGLTSAALTTGWQLGFTGPASPTSLIAVQEYQSSATAWTSATLTAFGGFTLVTAAYAIAPTQILVRITGLLVNGANAGTVQLQCRSEVAASNIVLKRGSTLLVT